MTSANDTAVPARSPFKRHAATLATTIAAICTAALCPLSCEGQTWTPGAGSVSTTGNVGIGTTVPVGALEVINTTGLSITTTAYGGSGNASSGLLARAARGALGAPTATLSNDRVGFLVGGAYGTSAWANNVAINLYAAGTQTDASHGSYITFDTTQIGAAARAERLRIDPSGNVGIGTTNPTSKLSVNGTIQAKEVVVNTGWSDYVFHPSYRLKPLTEVAAYIQRNHHLPDIPSEAEVRENGVSLGEMQSKLLAKIEELTLHTIQLDQQNRDLQARIARLEGRAATAQPAPDRPAAAPGHH